MTRALQALMLAIKARRPFFWWPRLGYCMRCGVWTWLTNERPAYSAYDGAFICEDCAIMNDDETRAAWDEYYSGRL